MGESVKTLENKLERRGFMWGGGGLEAFWAYKIAPISRYDRINKKKSGFLLFNAQNSSFKLWCLDLNLCW